MSNFVITIARAYGSGGKTIGKMLAKELGFSYYDKEIPILASIDSGINEKLFGRADEKLKGGLFKKPVNVYQDNKLIPPQSDDFVSDDNLFNYQAKVIKELAQKQSCVFVGRCADFVLKDMKNMVRVFVYASPEACIRNVIDMYGLSEKEAKKVIEKTDRQRAAYYKYYTGRDWDNARNYDLVLNSSELGFEKCTRIIEQYIRIKNS